MVATLVEKWNNVVFVWRTHTTACVAILAIFTLLAIIAILLWKYESILHLHMCKAGIHRWAGRGGFGCHCRDCGLYKRDYNGEVRFLKRRRDDKK